MHSFWVPRLAGKTDLIPNKINSMWIQPERTGLFLGQCAKYCGTQHAKMLLRVYVDTPEEFDRWAQEKKGRRKRSNSLRRAIGLRANGLHQLPRDQWHRCMTCLIIAESAIFTIFVVAYLFYLGKDISGPTPRQVLELPILNSICLLSSSATITFALQSLRNGDLKRFNGWWLFTIALGAYFLIGTGREWQHLIHDKGLTIQTNLFGTTFYSLVGLHASHVIIGLLALLIVMVFAVSGLVRGCT